MDDRQHSSSAERVIAVLAGATGLGLALFILVRNQPIADPSLAQALRLILSFSTAVLGATCPGFLNISWSTKGKIIRAGGAFALFLVTYTVAPGPSPGQTTDIRQISTGDSSPPIANNSGSISVNRTGK